MRILALLLLMANSVLFLWEYRAGALLPDKPRQDTGSNVLQPILLADKGGRINPSRPLEAVNERVPFVSDTLKGLAEAQAATDDEASLLFDGSVTVPWSEIIATAKPLPERDLRHSDNRESPVAVTGDTQWVTAASEQPSKPDAVAVTKAQPVKSKEFSTSAEPEASGEGKVLPQPDRAAAHESADRGTQNDTEKAVVVMECYDAGPFETMELYKQWRRQSGIDRKLITPIRREVQEVGNYLVYLPAPETYEQALANVRMLKSKGITDLWLFRKGESKGEISLGLFRNKSRADWLARQLLDKDLAVQIRPRYKSVQRLYAHFSIDRSLGEKLNESSDEWRLQHPEFSVQTATDCGPDKTPQPSTKQD